MAKAVTKKITDVLPNLLDLPSEHIWIDYDKEVDTMYISFRKPQKATDSELEDNMIFHYDGKELVGITIINARAQLGK